MLNGRLNPSALASAPISPPSFRHLHAGGIAAYPSSMRAGHKIQPQDDFIAPARRALRRAARKAREETAASDCRRSPEGMEGPRNQKKQRPRPPEKKPLKT